jgi:hypothetical protein
VEQQEKTITMTVLSDAVRLNNEGILLMMDGNDQSAVDCLKLSLATFKQALASPLSATETSTVNASALRKAREAGLFSSVENGCLHRSDCLLGLANLQKAMANEDDFYLYSKPMMLTANEAIGNSNLLDRPWLTVCCACVVFNLALVHHSIAQGRSHAGCPQASVGAMAMPFFQKAQTLYALASKLLDALPCGCDEDHVTASLLRLAAANNMAQIWHLQGDRDQSIERLMYISRLLQSDDCILSGTPLLDVNDRCGFLMNTFLILCRQDVAAAA